MREYLIKCIDDEWFNIPQEKSDQILKTKVLPSVKIPGWGNNRLRILGHEVVFSIEDPGIQVAIESPIDEALADKIAADILDNITSLTGQAGKIVPIT